VLGGASVALLQAWVSEPVQAWLDNARAKLVALKQAQMAMLAQFGLQVQPSLTNFFVVQLHADAVQHLLRVAALRQQGVALRDTSSMGLPGWARMRVHTLEAQRAFAQAWQQTLA
jgi:histidinol-phosphate aminotransferase